MRKKYYAWVICFGTMLLYFCHVGLGSNLLMVYLPFIEKTGITGSQGSSIVTVRAMMSLAGSLAVTLYYNRFSLRVGATVAMLAEAVAALLCAFAGNRLVLYYIAYGLAGAACGIGASVPMSAILENWFCEKKGFAVGIATMGSGIASVIFTPAVTAMVLNRGLWFSYMVQSIVIFACTAFLFVIMRDRPEELGLKKYGDREKNVRREDNKSGGSPEPVARILMTLILLMTGAAGNAGSSHVSITITTAGYSASQAAKIVMVYSVLLTAGKFLCGMAMDAYGTRKGSSIFLLSAGLGCLATTLMDGISMARAMAFACLMGFGYAGFTVSLPLWATDFSAPGCHIRTLKKYNILYAVGGIAFSSLPGMIADRTGEYKSSLAGIGVMLLASAVLLNIVYRTGKRKV